MNINDLLSPFLNTTTTDAISKIGPILISLLVAFAMGMLIYYVYSRAFRGVVYSHNFAISLPLMVILTTIVTLAISSNIALSLGMVGALSIVRYRTAIKDPMDLLFLFWSVTTGITVGANMHYLAVFGALISIVTILVIGKFQPAEMKYIMILNYAGDEVDDEIKRVLHNTKHKIRAKTFRQKDTELAIELVIRRDNLAFVEQLREIKGVANVALVQYSSEFHG